MPKDITEELEENRIIQCVACGATFNSVKELKDHNKEKHAIQG